MRKGLMFTCSAKVECKHLKLDLLVFHPIQKLTLNALTQTRKSSLYVILSMKVLPECYWTHELTINSGWQKWDEVNLLNLGNFSSCIVVAGRGQWSWREGENIYRTRIWLKTSASYCGAPPPQCLKRGTISIVPEMIFLLVFNSWG